VGRLIIKVSTSHTIRHARTHSVELLYTCDQLIAKAATHTTHNKRNGRTSMPSAGFEPAIPVSKRLQTHALEPTTIRICQFQLTFFM